MKHNIFWEKYIDEIRKNFKFYWKKNILTGDLNEEKFKELFISPRDVFIDFCKNNLLNYGSFAGIIMEWTFTQFLIAGLDILKKSDLAYVENNFQIPYKWKTSNVKKLNLDIVIKSKKTSKLFYAYEIKSNFEDGFDKFLAEEKIIYHHRSKVFPQFKYYYISLNKIPKITLETYKKKIDLLVKRNELYIVNSPFTKDVSIIAFLENIVNDIKCIE